MKKLITIAVAVAMLATLGAGLVLAAPSGPATKTAVDSSVAPVSPITWTPILSTNIKIAGNPKDIVIFFTAESTLVTNVKLSGNTGSQSQATIEVRAKLDGNVVPVTPGVVVLNDRLMKVKGSLGTDPLEWIEIYEKTKSANGFNFIAMDVGTGTHTVVIEAITSVTPGIPLDPEEIRAAVGARTLVVQEVNLK